MFIFEISSLFSSVFINSSTDISNISANFFKDSILGSRVFDSYFDIVAGLTFSMFAISIWVIFLFSLYDFILFPNMIKLSFLVVMILYHNISKKESFIFTL